ncbi:hypothetical protein CPX_001676 [Candidatus Phytoplasma pruni]|uniref:Uncharacterized protein n=1 Tax=Candidatus Phytoplasma pruni TaxID=479893 RepID=A0A0M1MZN7_9MOLU|nr:hypothetical protein [Candidatus Phytoplasma pruni]KOR75353.1 hypothetical protein CPX_001676 [Candidatus Phytoplasma pruni]
MKTFLRSHYTLEELKQMGDGAKTMYIFHNDSAESKAFQLVSVQVLPIEQKPKEIKKTLKPYAIDETIKSKEQKQEQKEPKTQYNYN